MVSRVALVIISILSNRLIEIPEILKLKLILMFRIIIWNIRYGR